MGGLLDWLQEPEMADVPVDGIERFIAHRKILERKAMIRDVFVEFHRLFDDLDRRYLRGEGMVVELGSGVFPVRESYPHVLATDVVPAPHLDRVLDGDAMDLADASVHAFYLQNVFHHLPQPARFFSELERTLVPGGGVILIEPHCGALASLLYPRLFASETYDKQAQSWDTPAAGPMSLANQALSHLIFDRDRARFEAENPLLEIVHRDVLGNGLRYLISGGLNFRSLAPAAATPLIRGLERLLRPLRAALGLHRVIVLRRRVDNQRR